MSDTQQPIEGKGLPVAGDRETLPPKLRRYTVAYKLRIIDEADACTAPGAVGALLRREGIYFSTLKDFRKQKARGDFGAAGPVGRAAKPSPASAQVLKD